MRHLLPAIAMATLLLALAPAGHAESEVIGPVDTQTSFGAMTVDQGVGDLDPLATSLRRLEPGNALHSTRVRLQQMTGTHGQTGQPRLDPATGLALPQTYRYSAPGVQALFDRPDYVMKTGPGRRDLARNVAARPDGAFIEAVPAGTIYDLRPETAIQQLMPQHAGHGHADDWQDTRIDARYRVDSRVGPGGENDRHIDRNRYPHIPPDTEVPSHIPRRFDPDEPAD